MIKSKKSEHKDGGIEIVPIIQDSARFGILGRTPLIQNQLSTEAQRELLYPKSKGNAAERKAKLKHDPLREFQDAIHRATNGNLPTLVVMPSRSFTKAIASSAVDIPGASKAAITRLVSIPDAEIAIYGTPVLYMTNVRQAGLNKAPDIRTRAVFKRWGAIVELNYVPSLITLSNAAALLSAAGILIGIGDDRREKGGSMGAYDVVPLDDPTLVALMKTEAKKAQEAAIEDPGFYDAKTEELYSWFQEQVIRRERETQLAVAKKRKAA